MHPNLNSVYHPFVLFVLYIRGRADYSIFMSFILPLFVGIDDNSCSPLSSHTGLLFVIFCLIVSSHAPPRSLSIHFLSSVTLLFLPLRVFTLLSLPCHYSHSLFPFYFLSMNSSFFFQSIPLPFYPLVSISYLLSL